MIHEAKNRPCMDCGVRFPYYVMELDHRDPAQKLFGINKALKHPRPTGTLAAELAKCDAVCANCHRERSWKAKHHLLGQSRQTMGAYQLPLELRVMLDTARW